MLSNYEVGARQVILNFNAVVFGGGFRKERKHLY